MRVARFLNGPGGAFALAVVVFVLALAGHPGLGLALAMAGVMVAYGLVILAGRRWDPIAVLAAPDRDERTFSVHLRASAAAGQVMALIIVGGFPLGLSRFTVRVHEEGMMRGFRARDVVDMDVALHGRRLIVIEFALMVARPRASFARGV